MKKENLGKKNREDTSPDRRRRTQIFPFRDSRLACYCDVTRKHVQFSLFLLRNFNSTVHSLEQSITQSLFTSGKQFLA